MIDTLTNKYRAFAVSILLIFSTFTQHADTAEIDSVSSRKLALADVHNDINALLNERIREGIQRANQQVKSSFDSENLIAPEPGIVCDEDKLYTELRKSIFQSFTASWGLKGYDLDRQLRAHLAGKSYSLALEESIYRDLTFLEGFSLNLKGLSDVANVNGALIGLDKIGHFFAEGWQYFEISNDPDQSLSAALEWGQQKERGMFGFTTTGIFSYADLATNLDGWRFWNKILLKKPDPLKGLSARLLEQPYIRCEIQILDSIQRFKLVRAWEVQNEFDITDYVNPAWDEGINCNLYANAAIEEKVMTRIHETNPDFSCPTSIRACRWATVRYGEFSNNVLHPACRVHGETG